jgi:2-polyprenyl-3-methyl-5-hydroxy-6-metoxy-1,4-benzoquinol methylase
MPDIQRINQWTPETIKKYWEWCSANPYLQKEYFSYQVGQGIISAISKITKIQGNVLDYGCGVGYLLEYLLKNNNALIYGVDFSFEAINKVNEKFKNLSNFKGAVIIQEFPLPFPDDFFDIITCIETIEHLQEENLKQLIVEFRRIIKKDGIIFFTTPNNEDLNKNMIYCPFCDTLFHKVQHVNSFDSNSLRILLEKNQLVVKKCSGIDFLELSRKKVSFIDYSLKMIIHGIFRRIKKVIECFIKQKKDNDKTKYLPHLYAVATKRIIL